MNNIFSTTRRKLAGALAIAFAVALLLLLSVPFFAGSSQQAQAYAGSATPGGFFGVIRSNYANP